jgi:hypothetical protein
MRTHRSLAQRGAAVIAAGLLGLGVTACGDMMDEFDQPPVDDMDPGVDDPGLDDGSTTTSTTMASTTTSTTMASTTSRPRIRLTSDERSHASRGTHRVPLDRCLAGCQLAPDDPKSS